MIKLMNVLLIIICVVFLSCMDDDSNGVTVIPVKTPVIPTSLNNYWIYSAVDSGQADTVRIREKKYQAGYTWWKLQNWSFPMAQLSHEFATRNDSIFTRQTVEGGGEIITVQFISPEDSSLTYHITIGGDAGARRTVTYHSDSVSVPAGTFSPYITYVTEQGDYRDMLFVVPKVGVVGRKIEGGYYSVPPLRMESYLVEYKVSQ